MTTPALEAIMDWFCLVFSDVVVDSKTGALFVRFERFVKSIRDHFVRSVLEGKEFAGVIVS